VVFIEGAERVTVSGCVFERVDGNAVLLSAYSRNVSITYNEFSWIGQTAVAAWGNTAPTAGADSVMPYGYGADGTNGSSLAAGSFAAFPNGLLACASTAGFSAIACAADVKKGSAGAGTPNWARWDWAPDGAAFAQPVANLSIASAGGWLVGFSTGTLPANASGAPAFCCRVSTDIFTSSTVRADNFVLSGLPVSPTPTPSATTSASPSGVASSALKSTCPLRETVLTSAEK
jgi:hypothetical protein